MATIDDIIANNLRALEQQEEQALRRALLRLQRALQQLDARVLATDPRLVYTDRFLTAMRDQVAAALDDARRLMAADMGPAIQQAVALGGTDAAGLIKVSTDMALARFNQTAYQVLAETLTNPDSPLYRVLAAYGPDTLQAFTENMLAAKAAGLNPTQAAREALRQMTNMAQHKARTIARTEMLRAYRASNLETYRQSRVVREWEWHSSLDRRTCASCWAMHGQRFPTEEPMGTHPNCRCAMLPVTDGSERYPTGPEEFEWLSEAEKRDVLGPAAYRAYQDDAVALPDMVRTTTTPEWGTTRTTESLVGVLGADAKRYYR